MKALSFLVLAPAAMLSACISFGPDAPPFLLTLTPDQAVQAGAVMTGSQSSALIVTEPSTPQKLSVTRIPVTSASGTISYLKDGSWADTPARLFTSLLSETIAARGRLVLDEAESGGKSQDYLTGELVDFGVFEAPARVVVTYDAVRKLPQGRVEIRRFSATRPLTTIEPATAGAALNSAANEVAETVAAWVAG